MKLKRGPQLVQFKKYKVTIKLKEGGSVTTKAVSTVLGLLGMLVLCLLCALGYKKYRDSRFVTG